MAGLVVVHDDNDDGRVDITIHVTLRTSNAFNFITHTNTYLVSSIFELMVKDYAQNVDVKSIIHSFSVYLLISDFLCNFDK